MNKSDILKTSPAVFAVGRNYHIMVFVNEQVLMWVDVGGKRYYDNSNGIIRSSGAMHTLIVSMEELDKAGEYILGYRQIIERKPYFTKCGEEVNIVYKFCPVKGGAIRAFHIADAHNMIDAPVKAAKCYEEKAGKLDFLILNGDVIDHSGRIENFENIYIIAEQITGGNIPVVFSRGNHDTRGIFAENLAEYTPCENGKSYYSFRLGKIWGLVLDCGEDKADEHEVYGHTNCCHSFRKNETDFIKGIINDSKRQYDEKGVEHRIVIVM